MSVNNKSILIGIFKHEEDAALAYNREVFRIHGEFAYLNKIKETL
jgi:hypothetical protein